MKVIKHRDEIGWELRELTSPGPFFGEPNCCIEHSGSSLCLLAGDGPVERVTEVVFPLDLAKEIVRLLNNYIWSDES